MYTYALFMVDNLFETKGAENYLRANLSSGAGYYEAQRKKPKRLESLFITKSIYNIIIYNIVSKTVRDKLLN